MAFNSDLISQVSRITKPPEGTTVTPINQPAEQSNPPIDATELKTRAQCEELDIGYPENKPEQSADYEEEEEQDEKPRTYDDAMNMLQEAAKLKSAQLDYKCKEYQAAPEFMKSTYRIGKVESDPVLRARGEPMQERLRLATAWKIAGNALVSSGDFSGAVSSYEKAIGVWVYFESDGEYKPLRPAPTTLPPEQQSELTKLLVACFNNTALCLNKQGLWEAAIYAAGQALLLSEEDTKALFRRAQAYEGLEAAGGSTQCLELALSDLQIAQRLQPGNKEVTSLAKKIKSTLRQQNKKDSTSFSGMFGRGELYTQKELDAEIERKKREEDKGNEVLLDQQLEKMRSGIKKGDNGLYYDQSGRLVI